MKGTKSQAKCRLTDKEMKTNCKCFTNEGFSCTQKNVSQFSAKKKFLVVLWENKIVKHLNRQIFHLNKAPSRITSHTVTGNML